MADEEVAVETRYGQLVVPNGEDTISRFLAQCGEWGWDEASFVASVLPENARILDVGAFLGTFGLGVALRENVSFVCFVEANTKVLPMLQRNIEDNATTPAIVVSAMVTGFPAMPRAGRREADNLGSTSYADDAPDGPVAEPADTAITLADLRTQYGAFDLIKLDVEGMEEEILKGDRDYLVSSRTTLWVECNERRQSLELADMLLSWGHDVYYFAFPSHNPENYLGKHDPIFPWAYEAGLLVAPTRVPRLSADLAAHACILRPIKTVEELREALWLTPRWLPVEFAKADLTELAAIAGRALRGQYRDAFLSVGTGPKTIGERLAATEEGLARAEALAFERQDELLCEREFREAADRRLADTAALALSRLQIIQTERERINVLTAAIEEAINQSDKSESRALDFEARAQQFEARLAAIEASIAWRLITPALSFIGNRPRLHKSLRRVRAFVGTMLGRRRLPEIN